MTVSLLFWLLMLLWLLFGLYGALGPKRPSWGVIAGDLVPFILLLLLGWQVFGAPIK